MGNFNFYFLMVFPPPFFVSPNFQSTVPINFCGGNCQWELSVCTLINSLVRRSCRRERRMCSVIFHTVGHVPQCPLKVVQMPHLFLDCRAGLNLDVLSHDCHQLAASWGSKSEDNTYLPLNFLGTGELQHFIH